MRWRIATPILATSAFLAAWLAFAPSVARPNDLAHAVLAYYYVWYDEGSFASALFQPLQPYNSDDMGVMQRHVDQAKSAGLDGFIVDWYGNGDRTDANFAKLLDISEKSGFSATVHFETPHFWGADDVVAQLRAFTDHYANRPGLVRYQGRPVLFFWRAATFDNGTWSSIRAQVDPDHRFVWMADGDNFGILGGDAWDGISPYAIAWSGDPASQLPRWANVARSVAPDKLWNPVVSPGCDDSGVRAATCVRDRAGGSYYQSSWDGALASSPDWAVVVSTFNEWMESTQIEPSTAWGDQYLQLTKQNADLFRASVS
jgi:hypothetical protein